MQYFAFRMRARKSAGMCVAMAAIMALGGCSGSTSRFDFPSYGIANKQGAPSDQMATASLTPVPSAPVYGNGGAPNGGPAVASRALPPIGSAPEPYPYQSAQSSPAQVHLAAHSGPALSPRRSYADAEENASRKPGASFSGKHRVGNGDTLYGVARRHGVSPKELAEQNDLSVSSSLRIGQVLQVPGGAKSPARPQRAIARNDEGAPSVRVVKTVAIAAPDASPVNPVRMSDAGPAPMPAANPDRGRRSDVVLAKADPSEPVASAPEERPVQRNAALPEPEPMTGNSFRWPVKGKIISEFGTKPNGSHNDGINVAVPQGTSVKAAENGVVAYAGSELKGYGNLILIRHANNWVSAYAHNDDIIVKRGDKVRRGQIISKAGKTGSVSQPQVHFELRKGSRPVDPTKYMKDA